MFGQVAASEFRVLIENAGDVPIERIPEEEITEEIVEKFSDSGKIKISLLGLFKLLKAASHIAGDRFYENENRFLGLLEARNSSILAHGIKPISESTYQTFFSMVTGFLELDDLIKMAKFPTV